MDALLEFARGPLFRFSLAVMLLGLVRVVALDMVAAYLAWRKAGDKDIPWAFILKKTVQWIFPVNRVMVNRPFYSVFSILFHVGLLVVPLFLFAHVELWKGVLGFGWITLPKALADWLTISTIVFATALIIGRIFHKASRFISRKQDYLWPIVLLVPFVTGLICANMTVEPTTYKIAMLMHVLSADIIFILLPFTKIAHCVLFVFSQLISSLAWKFPPTVDDDVATTLHKKGAPV